MILRMLILVLAVSNSLTSALFAGGERGNHLIAENGGTPGLPGVIGLPGAPGLPGTPGVPGGTATVLAGADFYALMPSDNPAPTLPNAPIAFPNTTLGSSFGGIINGGATFTLPNTGTYAVLFQVSVTEPAQLGLTLNGALLPNTVVGRATGSTQIVGFAYITAAAGNTLQVINAGGLNLTVTPKAGQSSSANSVSAHLVILQIQ